MTVPPATSLGSTSQLSGTNPFNSLQDETSTQEISGHTKAKVNIQHLSPQSTLQKSAEDFVVKQPLHQEEIHTHLREKNIALLSVSTESLSKLGKEASKSGLPMTNWMEALLLDPKRKFGERKVHEISFPGSHDAATYTMKDGCMPQGKRYAVTQTKDLTEQLDAGARYFDIRLNVKPFSQNLRFFHGQMQSDKHVVGPEMARFFEAVLARNELVILKLDFGGNRSHQLFKSKVLNDEIRAAIAKPDDVENLTIRELLENNKKIILLTKGGEKPNQYEMKYKQHTLGKWAKTRDPDQLAEEMNRVRSNIDPKVASKLKVIQTNQPALVGTSGTRFLETLETDRFDSVIEHDRKTSSRMAVNSFIHQSHEALDAARLAEPIEHFLAYAQLLSNISKLEDFSEELDIPSILEQTAAMTRGVISLDNIGDDQDKAELMQMIIGLNHY
ncbi:PI-PLC domain-containing protein [Algicola sagamiensis]|uniref:hypothetical protein n=1 Tax=Algicola sagamiensis TaxID=163869 RepID=UPI000367F1F3|nr:hypothetical protein [Algicola sagamiensis]